MRELAVAIMKKEEIPFGISSKSTFFSLFVIYLFKSSVSLYRLII